MATKTPPRLPEKPVRATLSSRNAITLPADVRRQLGIGPGDEVEIIVDGSRATVQKVEQPIGRDIRGLLTDYFTDREDVRQFVERERSGWDQ